MTKTIWLYGPSGAGKTTAGHMLASALKDQGKEMVLLDGDRLRATVSADLGFGYDDRAEQTRRTAAYAKSWNDRGLWCIVCLITPFEEFRQEAKEVLGDRLTLICLDSPLEDRLRRDPKGLYARAKAGDIKGLTGYDGDFDQPDPLKCHTVSTAADRTREQTLADILAIIEPEGVSDPGGMI